MEIPLGKCEVQLRTIAKETDDLPGEELEHRKGDGTDDQAGRHAHQVMNVNFVFIVKICYAVIVNQKFLSESISLYNVSYVTI